MHDQELIDRCLAGRSEAFGSLVERYQQRLFQSLVHVLGSRDDAEDVAQEAFIHAFQKLTSFRGESAFYSWLFRIALNAAATARRKTRRVAASLDQQAELGWEPLDHGAAPERGVDLAEEQVMVQQALADLPEEFRMVIVLKEMEGLRYEEIAQIIEIPVGTVRSRLHRGRQELRQRLRMLLKGHELVDEQERSPSGTGESISHKVGVAVAVNPVGANAVG